MIKLFKAFFETLPEANRSVLYVPSYKTGNCFPDSISVALGLMNHPKKSKIPRRGQKHVRNAICDFMMANRDRYEDFILLIRSDDAEENDYQTRLPKSVLKKSLSFRNLLILKLA